jgi:hypothetical protein
METIEVLIGGYMRGTGGYEQDDTRPVEFEGEELASVTDFIGGDTRGVTETLYKTEDGDLAVHIEDWSRWQGEPTTYCLQAVSEEDLGPGGRFEKLGRKAGMGRPLTLEEALEASDA